MCIEPALLEAVMMYGGALVSKGAGSPTNNGTHGHSF